MLTEIASYGGQAEFDAALSPQGTYGRWIRGHNAVIRINDVLFVHGGLPLDSRPVPLATINEVIRSELAGATSPALSVDPKGVLWTRALARDDDEDLGASLESVLRFYEAKAVVAGHTVVKDGIQVRFSGRVILTNLPRHLDDSHALNPLV